MITENDAELDEYRGLFEGFSMEQLQMLHDFYAEQKRLADEREQRFRGVVVNCAASAYDMVQFHPAFMDIGDQLVLFASVMDSNPPGTTTGEIVRTGLQAAWPELCNRAQSLFDHAKAGAEMHDGDVAAEIEALRRFVLGLFALPPVTH